MRSANGKNCLLKSKYSYIYRYFVNDPSSGKQSMHMRFCPQPPRAMLEWRDAESWELYWIDSGMLRSNSCQSPPSLSENAHQCTPMCLTGVWLMVATNPNFQVNYDGLGLSVDTTHQYDLLASLFIRRLIYTYLVRPHSERSISLVPELLEGSEFCGRYYYLNRKRGRCLLLGSICIPFLWGSLP